MNILVVDDEEAIQALFNQWYAAEIKEGLFDFYFALSAEQALKCLEEDGGINAILILSDINMPGMNGLELLKIIKAKHSGIPVVVITAYGDEENFKTAMKYGADDFIRKPLDMFKLKQKLVDYINKQKE